MAILDAILEGERDRYKLAEVAHLRVQASPEEFAKSLEGNWRPELLVLLRQEQDIYREYHKRIGECDEAIQAQLKTMENKSDPGAHRRDPKQASGPAATRRGSMCTAILFRISGIDLTRIDGINVMKAQTVVAEENRAATPFGWRSTSLWRSKTHLAVLIHVTPK